MTRNHAIVHPFSITVKYLCWLCKLWQELSFMPLSKFSLLEWSYLTFLRFKFSSGTTSNDSKPKFINFNNIFVHISWKSCYTLRSSLNIRRTKTNIMFLSILIYQFFFSFSSLFKNLVYTASPLISF